MERWEIPEKDVAMPGPAPAGYTTVAPWIVTADTGKLLDFIVAAFNGEELGRVPLEDGSIGHAEIRVGDTILLAFDQRPGWPHAPSMLRVFVDEADATMEQAVARIVTRPSNHAFGQRTGRVCDPSGDIWWTGQWSKRSRQRRSHVVWVIGSTPTRCAKPKRPPTLNSGAWAGVPPAWGREPAHKVDRATFAACLGIGGARAKLRP
jgi:uncharacterized glyoxalase superfamily protein PhnB